MFFLCYLQWSFIPLPVFLIFRIFEVLALSVGVFYGFVISAQYGMGFGQYVYLTIWTYNIAAVFHISAAVCTFAAYLRRPKSHLSRSGQSHLQQFPHFNCLLSFPVLFL